MTTYLLHKFVKSQFPAAISQFGVLLEQHLDHVIQDSCTQNMLYRTTYFAYYNNEMFTKRGPLREK